MKLNPFAKITRAERAEQLLTEARLAEVEHAAAAEHHAALAGMYRGRALRLEAELQPLEPKAAPVITGSTSVVNVIKAVTNLGAR
jgi:hypothetical protein